MPIITSVTFRLGVRGGRQRTSVGLPSKAKKGAILKRQGWKCLYCGLSFWSWRIYDHFRGKIVEHTIHWDHFIPYAYTQTHFTAVVAACNICNLMKWSKIFDTLKEARDYLKVRWRDRYSVWENLGSGLADGAEKPFRCLANDSDSVGRDADSIGITIERGKPYSIIPKVTTPLSLEMPEEKSQRRGQTVRKLESKKKKKLPVPKERIAQIDFTEIDKIIAERRHLKQHFGL